MSQRLLCMYGWNSTLEDSFRGIIAESETAHLKTALARVIRSDRDRWIVVLERDGRLEEVEAIVLGGSPARKGRTRSTALPVTGDWVMVRDSEDPVIVESILPRSTRFSRKTKGETAHDRVAEQVLVSNVDIAILVCAAGHDWNPRRVERYLALVHESGARAVLVISKADLAGANGGIDSLVEEGKGIMHGGPVIAVSAKNHEGLEELVRLLEPGSTCALLGSSGAGKSTILNTLSGQHLEEVHEVRADDHRGRHTTVARHLYRLDGGQLLIDTPGLREIQLWVEARDIDSAFPDIMELALKCRYRDCTHVLERDCAVVKAIGEGILDPGRLESWRRLRGELNQLALRRGRAKSRRAQMLALRQKREYPAQD